MFRRLFRRIRYDAGYFVLCALQRVIWSLPRRARLRVGAWLGRAAFHLLRTERRRALDHLAIAFPDKTEATRREIASASFAHLGMSAMETLSLPRMSRDEVIALCANPEAIAFLPREVAAGQKLVLITGHLGNWEMLAAIACELTFPVHTLARRLRDPRMNAAVEALRAVHGLRTVYADESPKTILRLVREGRPVAFLADQDLPDHDGVWVDFFGRPAYTPSAPTALARSSGARIYVFALFREGERYRFRVEGPIEPERTGDRDADIRRVTARWTAMLEEMIRAEPTQWVWMHRRWRTTPERLARHRARMRGSESGGTPAARVRP